MTSNYWARARRATTSRRALLRGAGIAGLGLAGAALIGCGDDDDDDDGGGASSGTSTPTGTPTSGTEVPTGGPKSGGTFRRAVAGDPTSLDPYASGSFTAKTLAAHVYSRLLKLNTGEGLDPFDQGPVPDAAVSVETSDGQHLTIKLREGIKFHDIPPVNGRELTSEDVLFSFTRATGDEAPNSSQVSNWVDMQAVDDYTLNLTLDAPSPEALDQLADANLLYIQPVEADGGFDPLEQPIGSGPWLLEEFVASSRLAYKKHPNYFVDGLPYMDGIDESIIPEDANQLAQFEAGNLDQASIAALQLLDLQSRHPDTSWLPGTGNGMAWIIFSGKEVSPDAVWRDPRFRQAASMAIDRDGLLDLAGNATELLAAGFESTTLTRWNNIPQPSAFGPRFWLDPRSAGQGDTAKYFEYNPGESKKILDAIGDDSKVTYQYTNRYSDTFLSLAEAAGNLLVEAGFNIETEVQDYSSKYITNTFRGDFQGMAYGLESTLTPGGYAERFFGADSANHGRVHEPEMDELLLAQSRELDEEARTEIFYEMARRNAESMYYIPAQSSSTTSWTGYSARMSGLRRVRGYGSGTEAVMHYWIDA
jgi:peptide/nickel transport system substrate-binding protein